MKILVFSYSGSMTGGANRSLLMVLDVLKEKYHHEILVVVPQEGQLCKELNEIGISWLLLKFNQISGIKDLRGMNSLRWVRNNIYALMDQITARKFAKSIRNVGFDVIYINDVTAYIGAFVGLILKIPFVWHFRSLVQPGERYIIGAKGLFGRCNQIIAISYGMKSLLIQNKYMPKNKITMIHNGLPLENASRSIQTRINGMHFVECGRIAPEKGHADAIKALGILKKQGIDDVFLHIVGADLSNRKNGYSVFLRQLASELNVEKQVIYEGTRNDMPEFRKEMNGELMCAVAEPFGRVTLEGMRSGLVVIGSNSGGTPEIIIDGDTGLLYEQGDAEDLARKIKMVYKEPQLALDLAEKAYEYSQLHFLPETNVSSINTVLESVVNIND